jgi:Flp pilus assembly protein TadG
MKGIRHSTARGLAHFRKLARCNRGVAAIEFAVIGSALSVSILNTADVALYFFDRIQVENAAEMAAEAALKACDITHLPATDNCAGLSDAVSAAVESTSLGAQVTLQGGSPSEGYYCINADNALEYVSDTSSKPSDCTAAGNPSLRPGDYIEIQASYVYSPLFPGITVAALFPTPITTTAWMRMG